MSLDSTTTPSETCALDAEIRQFLGNPASYPDPTSHVQSLESHISWIYLTDRYVYKRKKPVRFDFLDFSTLQQRQVACNAEVQLNRRLAPDVYVGAFPIVRDAAGTLHIERVGIPVDWLVKMRRLPEKQAMDRLIAAGDLTEESVRKIANRLIDFYRKLPPLSARTADYRRQFRDHVAQNRQELLQPEHGFDPSVVKRVHTAQLQLLELTPELLDHRVIDGRIVEGHGDLRPEHIYLTPAPVMIDCIEFSAEFRRLDVLDELSFLAMECAFLGAADVGQRVIETYCKSCGDHPAETLRQFYFSYRACVRAKVHALRAAQFSFNGSTPAVNSRAMTLKKRNDALQVAHRYLELADGAAQGLGGPLMVVVRGLSGVGKSTLASGIAESLGMDPIRTDSVRREMFGRSEHAAPYDADNYSAPRRAAVYAEMFRQAEEQLAKGVSIVLDGTFLSTALRTQAVALARRRAAAILLVHCKCPLSVAADRIAARAGAATAGGSSCVSDNTLSEAEPNFVRRQAAQEEPDPLNVSACTVDSTESVPSLLEKVFLHLRAVAPRAEELNR